MAVIGCWGAEGGSAVPRPREEGCLAPWSHAGPRPRCRSVIVALEEGPAPARGPAPTCGPAPGVLPVSQAGPL